MATTRRRGHPMARRMPISFVRSRTLVIIVLSVPIPPIAIATIDVIQAIASASFMRVSVWTNSPVPRASSRGSRASI